MVNDPKLIKEVLDEFKKVPKDVIKEAIKETLNEDRQYLENKRLEVLEKIKPIMDAFKIKDYDYAIDKDGRTETLIIEGQKIGCSMNSVEATIEEIVGYIFINYWNKRGLGAFKKQTFNAIKRYWK